MTRIYFISTNTLKAHTPIPLNVDDQLLTMAINNSQEINIQQALGSQLYKKIKTAVENKSITGDYKTLLDEYIIPALIQYTLANVLIYLQIKFTNKSVSTQTSDNSFPVDADQIKYLTQIIKNDAKFYGERMSAHLIANTDKYPEYTKIETCEDMPSKTSAYFSGMVLDEDRSVFDRLLGTNDGIINL